MRKILVVAIVVLLTTGCPPKNNLTGVTEAVRQSLGISKDQNIRVGAFLPTIGTLYCPEVLDPKTKKDPDSCLYSDPSTWFQNPGDTDKTENAIFVHRSIDGFQTNQTVARDIKVTADVPLIGRIVSASGSVDVGKNTKVTISGGSATKEIIAWFPFRDAIKAHTFTTDTSKLLLSKN